MKPWRLLSPPAHLNALQRRAWRILAWVNLLVALAALGWVPALLAMGQPEAAVIYGVTAATAVGALRLLTQGRRRWALWLTLAMALAFALVNGLWVSPPSPGLSLGAHLYLLALGVVSTLATREEPRWLRLGYPALCMGLYLLMAGWQLSWYSGPPATGLAYEVAHWFDHTVPVAVILLALHVLQTDAVRLDGLAAELRLALDQQRLQLHYQPQVDGAGRLVGVEALLRWPHTQRGWVPPSDFIPLAEQSGLMPELGHWVLRQACAQLAAWRQQPGLQDLVVAVNVSAQQFDQPDFVPTVVHLLQQQGLPPALLKVELTESALAQDLAGVINKMQTLRAHGVALALDDFGTGFSSLSLLRQLPLNEIKIDQAFVRDLTSSAEAEAIARAIVAMGLGLGMDVVAEGVETEAQRAALARMGCGAYQRWLIARPLQAEELAAWVRQRPAPALG
ncbi:MAG: putative bifunctional diguanylate cyclase/phosphodiesterase [Rubrivivax sp.]